MPDYGIEIEDVEIIEIGVEDVAITKAFIKDVQVWELPSTGGAVITSSIDDIGEYIGDVSGLYVFEQSSTDGSGTGAKFAVTVSYIQRRNRSYISAQQINTGDEGSGYAVGDLITLNPAPTGVTWATNPVIEVLSVTT